MIMKAKMFGAYVDALLDADLPNLRTIRIGTKALAYWPYKFLTDNDASELLGIFSRVTQRGLHLAIMSHFNHLAELATGPVRTAIRELKKTGAEIRTQSPLLAHINDDASMWGEMWRKQVQMGCIPYYMFVVRDTGAQHYFGVPLTRAYEIFRNAYMRTSGLCRTVRGPSMSATPGKVLIDGTPIIHGKRVMSLRFIQGRNPEWVHKPFYAEHDESALWLDDLRPAFGDRFFFADEMERKYGHAGTLKRD